MMQTFHGDYVPTSVAHRIHAHSKEAICVTFNSYGSLIATGGGDNLVKIWDLNRNNEPTTLKLFGKPISAITFTTDVDRIIACCLDNTIKVCKLSPRGIEFSMTGHTDMITSCFY